MPSTGETAPTLTATYRGSDHETFDLADHLGDGPVVLAFFAGASTPPCSNEMVVLQEHLDEFEAAGATVFGVSADSSFSQSAFAEEYGLSLDLPDLGLHGVASRAVYVLDEDGTVIYSWVTDDPTNEPDYEALLEAVRAV